MSYLWHELRLALPLIFHGDPYIWSVTWVTVRVAVVSTGLALLLGLPLGLALGLGRFRGRRALQVLAGTGLALPPVIVGVAVLLVLLPGGPLGSLHAAFTLRAVFIAQTLLALPYIVALTPPAVQSLPAGLLAQARALGARRVQLAWLATREARVGILVAVIAALGSSLAEVGAVVVAGGNIENRDQTLAGAMLQQVSDYANYPYGLAIGIVLLALVLVLAAALTVVQQWGTGPGPSAWRPRALSR